MVNIRDLVIKEVGTAPTIQELRIDRKRTFTSYNHKMLQFAIDHEIDILVQDYYVYTFQYLKNHNLAYKDGYEYYDWLFHFYLYDKYKVFFPKLLLDYNRNEAVKLHRLFDRIEHTIDYITDTDKCYFLTLTLKDTYTTETITRDIYSQVRKEIRTFVKNYSDRYVLNKDFGLNETKRLHFHGVAIIPKGYIDSFKFRYNKKFGFCDLDLIRGDSNILSRYIEKLSYHALKVNYGYCKENLIYSRGF